ncbi:MAG: hypothetical protein L6461_09520 [Anaerolineae bacterium]|nr:hypothetical protein [Anaerolineae bacterium]
MNNDYMTLNEIRVLGFETLLRELGPVATIRFMQQYESGRGNYTRDRHKWLTKKSVKELAQEITKEKKP